MPIYEYQCKSCNLIHEEIRNLNDAEDKSTCPKCNSVCIKVLPRKYSWRWCLREGVWENQNGQEKFLGKGGPSRILGGEKLNVMENFPEMSEPQESDKDDTDKDDLQEDPEFAKEYIDKIE